MNLTIREEIYKLLANMALREGDPVPTDEEGLISPIPGGRAAIEHIQALEAEIALAELQRQQGDADLELDLKIAKAQAELTKSLFDVDEAAAKLIEVFHK